MRRWWVVPIAVLAMSLSCSQEGTGSSTGRARPSPGETIVLSPDRPPSPEEAPPATPDPDVTFGHAKVLIDTDEGSVIVDAEKAETPEQRQLGLMFRESLGPDEGMVFLFFEETASAFWMKNVTIPLSVAFFDADGTILKILDMEPCERDPCELYDPLYDDGRAVTYVGALEVEQGRFEEWGVEEGDRITVTH